MILERHSFSDGTQVRLIDALGENKEFVTFIYALKEAEKEGLPLVLVNDGNPPICKIMDYHKKNFEQKKKKSQQKVKSKEVQFSSVLHENDFQTKIKQVREFIKKDYKVDITMKVKKGENFRGGVDNKRLDIFQKVFENVSDIAKWESEDTTKRTLVKK